MNPGPVRVLIVDDNQVTLDGLQMLMTSQGRIVRTALNGLDALDLAGEFRPDVVLLDIGMPGIDGYEVARRLRTLPELPAVRIVAVTGYGQPLDRVMTQQAGFDEHLVKPVDPEELESVFASVRLHHLTLPA